MTLCKVCRMDPCEAHRVKPKSKPLWPAKHEELLQAAERYAISIQHDFMTPEMDRFLEVLRKERQK